MPKYHNDNPVKKEHVDVMRGINITFQPDELKVLNYYIPHELIGVDWVDDEVKANNLDVVLFSEKITLADGTPELIDVPFPNYGWKYVLTVIPLVNATLKTNHEENRAIPLLANERFTRVFDWHRVCRLVLEGDGDVWVVVQEAFKGADL